MPFCIGVRDIYKWIEMKSIFKVLPAKLPTSLPLSPTPAHLLAKRIVQEDEALLSGVICGSGTLPKHPCFRSTVKEHRFNYLYLIFWWAILCTLLYLLIEHMVFVCLGPMAPSGSTRSPFPAGCPTLGPRRQAVIGQIRKQTACGLSLRTLPQSSRHRGSCCLTF